LRGEHCSQSQFLLNKILREAWGYDGVVISDWGAVHDTEEAAKSSLFDTNNIEPRFCFGHGLSYTSFEYSDLNISVKGCEVEVSLNAKNTGSSAGTETVQLYLSDLEASTPRPSKELKRFK
jgi:hypothetical protein